MKRLVILLLVAACGGGHDPADIDAPAGSDAPADTTPDAPPFDTGADIATTLQCGPDVPVGPGNAAEFQRATVDLAKFPDALCNDGTAAVLFFRPYNGAANRDKWLINIHGGGSCSSGASCAARWCSCDSTTTCPFVVQPTNFDRSDMTDARPPMKSADGLNLRGTFMSQSNPLGDYNEIELTYCSSDGWHGTQKGVTLMANNPKTNAPVTFKIDFLGAKILDADIAWLRQDGVPGLTYTLGGTTTAMPDLDDATEVVFTGDSAGGDGLIQNLDGLKTTLTAHNTNPGGLHVYGLLDAIVGLDRAPLDYGTYVVPQVRSYTDYLALRTMSAPSMNARVDTSCVQMHAANPEICLDSDHVIRNHVTTPFFVRMALRDMQIGGGFVDEQLRLPDMTPLTINNFAVRLHDELTAFAQLATTAEEGGAITKPPGVFAPGCVHHDTIHDTRETWLTTITPPAGTAQRLVPVFERWLTGAGTPTNILTEDPTLGDTNCP